MELNKNQYLNVFNHIVVGCENFKFITANVITDEKDCIGMIAQFLDKTQNKVFEIVVRDASIQEGIAGTLTFEQLMRIIDENKSK